TIYAEVDLRNFPSPARIIGISDGTSSNRIIVIFNTSNRIRLLATVTTSQVDISSSSQVAGIFKIAVAYALNDYAFYINGVQVGTDTAALVPACSLIALGNAETGAGSNINDRIRAAALYTTRLTNAELAALTTP
ncbi:MAG: LamG-like jellyroll fold domain-containing protein, partial [Polynucleobacter sp.]